MTAKDPSKSMFMSQRRKEQPVDPRPDIIAESESALGVPEDAGQYREELATILRKFGDRSSRVLEVGPGWYPLIIELDEKISEIVPDYRVLQVKEKFGGLRYYVQLPQGVGISETQRANVYALIDEYEERSFTICEVTGNPGVLMVRNGWFRTLDPETAPEGFVIASDDEEEE